jgi:hypothetical protein
MVLMEVNLLSGFSASSDSIPLSETLKKVEYDNGKLNLYLDSVSSKMFHKPLLGMVLCMVFRSLLSIRSSFQLFCL